MHTRNSLPLRRVLAALALALFITQSALAIDPPLEASHVRFLIVVDTDAGGGSTWGLDGRNFKTVVGAGLKKQQLDGRYSFETFSGKNVGASQVLQYYNDLQVEPDDVLVFYYSGHGATHGSKGHFMQLTHGPLFRKDLLAAMYKQQPRLVVLLTDCCANYAGGGPVPATPTVITPGSLDGAADIPDNPFPRRPTIKGLPGAADLEPIQVGDRKKKQKPPSAGTGAAVNGPGGNGVVLRTGDGPLPIKTILDKTDGTVLRHLFYRHTGLVDINGCQNGKSSHGTIPWGGSLFTIGFLALQKEPAAKFDANGNGLVEWSEFFPHLQTSCQRAGKTVNTQQIPDAVQLANPVLAQQ